MTVHTGSPVKCTLAFRIPGWCRMPAFTGPEGMERAERDGYVYFTGTWRDGDAVTMNFPMEVTLNSANPRVREDLGKAAVTRGPICYCLEEADNGADLHLCRVDTLAMDRAAARSASIGGREMNMLEVPGFRQEMPAKAPLYSGYAPAKELPVTLKYIPYFAWANRGKGEMRVWVRT